MCFLILEDESGRLPTAMTPPVYERFERVLREPGLLVEGRLEAPPEEKRNGKAGTYRSVLIDKVWSLETLCQIRSVHGAAGHPGQSPRVATPKLAEVA